jgi:hypothetical protein
MRQVCFHSRWIAASVDGPGYCRGGRNESRSRIIAVDDARDLRIGGLLGASAGDEATRQCLPEPPKPAALRRARERVFQQAEPVDRDPSHSEFAGATRWLGQRQLRNRPSGRRQCASAGRCGQGRCRDRLGRQHRAERARRASGDQVVCRYPGQNGGSGWMHRIRRSH